MDDHQEPDGELAALGRLLAKNQADIDFVELVLARGGSDARGMTERLTQLEAARGDLLDRRDQLLRPDLASSE